MFLINNTKLIGETIAKGICDYYGVSTEDSSKTKEKTLYTVQVGAFSNKSNAIKYADKLKQSGISAIVIAKD